MKITTILPINFGYKSILKTLYLEGEMPEVKYDIYGNKLTKKNVTLEHLCPKSQGGKSDLHNFALCQDTFNWSRSSKPFKNYFNPEAFEQYCKQFDGVKFPGFDGKKYVEAITKTVERLLKR